MIAPPTLIGALVAALLLVPAHVRAEAASGACRSPELPRGDADQLAADLTVRGDLQALLDDAVARRVTQKASLVVLRRGRLLFAGGAGGAGPRTVFDAASLTKVVATAPLVLRWMAHKNLPLSMPVSRQLRRLDRPDKRAITVEQLLTHTSGLPSVVWAGTKHNTREDVLPRIPVAKMVAAPGQRWGYSDTGFIVLGELVARLAQAPLDRVARRNLFGPLQMCDTWFNPPKRLHKMVASAWPEGGKPGQVYDPLGHRLGGVAGHAGLFSTALDMARFGQMMLDRGTYKARQILKKDSVWEMTRARPLPGNKGNRGLGWDISSPHAGVRGRLSAGSYGHTGFTGTSLWIDPRLQLVVALLTNRTRIKPARSVNGLRRRVHNTVVGSVYRPGASGDGVRSGLDRLVGSDFASLRGRKVALLTNKSAVDRRGRWIGDLLAAAPGVTLTTLMVPEHGLSAALDRHIKDNALKLGKRRVKVFSLYGGRRRPDDACLAGADTVVFDVPVVGVRFYTYLATMGWAMEEAAKRKLRFVVLDRPDPLGGTRVQGPVSSPTRRTSTNYHPLPLRYGMTVGELASMYNAERKIGVDLHVERLSGWRRGEDFARQGLPWRNPSPNIRSIRQALLYGGVGVLETTNLAVGRGTDAPFQLLGAPFINGKKLARVVNRQRPRGVYAVPIRFSPKSSKHRKKRCGGVRLVLTAPDLVDPARLGLTLAKSLHRLYPKAWDTRALYKLWSSKPTAEAIRAGRTVAAIERSWRAGLTRFRKTRKKYLLYR